MRLLHILFSALFLLLSVNTLYAKNVLVITWQGKMVSEDAFEAHLKTLVPDVKFSYMDAGRNKSALAKKLRGEDMSKYDLVYSFGTTCTKIVQQFLKGTKPHIFNIVSAPRLSGIVKSMEKPGNNTTGAKFLIDFKTQLEVLDQVSGFKTLGVWFDPREKQNAPVLKALKNIGEAMGKKVTPIRIIPDAAAGEKMIKNGIAKANTLDAVYMIASSSFSGRYGKMFSGIRPDVVIMTTISSYTEHGATIALGVEWEERGREVAAQAAKILGGANAGDIPVSIVKREKATLFLNRKRMVAAKLKDVDKLGMIVKFHNQIQDD